MTSDLGDEPLHEPCGARLLQVKADVPFASIEVQVGARMLTGRRQPAEAAHEVALRRLDFDDLGAVLAKPPSADRADHDAGQIQHTNSRERFPGHRTFHSYRS